MIFIYFKTKHTGCFYLYFVFGQQCKKFKCLFIVSTKIIFLNSPWLTTFTVRNKHGRECYSHHPCRHLDNRRVLPLHPRPGHWMQLHHSLLLPVPDRRLRVALHTERAPRRPLSPARTSPLPLRVPRLSVRLRHGVAALLGPSWVLLVQQSASALQWPAGLRSGQYTLFRPLVRQPRLPPGYRHSMVCALRTRSSGKGLVRLRRVFYCLLLTTYGWLINYCWLFIVVVFVSFNQQFCSVFNVWF